MVRRIPPLKALFVFKAAARHESFKKAAEELHVTHAAVSHQIRALEDWLGQELFQCTTRQVTLTEPAKQFARRLDAAFEEIADATDAMTEKPLEGEITISLAPFFGNRMLVPRLPRFAKAFPAISIRLDMSSEVVDLRSSKVDAGLRYGTGDWRGLTSILLAQDEVRPVAAPAYVGARSLPMSADDVAELTLAQNIGAREDWENWFKAAGRTDDAPLTFLDYPDRARALDLALSGSGVALADTRLTAMDEAAGHLVGLSDVVIPSRKSMHLVFPSSSNPDPRLLALADWLKSDLVDSNP